MKSINFSISRSCLLVLLLAMATSGCSLFSSSGKKSNVMDQPDANPGEIARLHVGDSVSIHFSGPPEPPESQEKFIKEDGTISLPDIGRVKASGKTPGELEDSIHDLYVPRIYRHLNVTVKTSGDRVYFVRGEVKAPGRLIYTGAITVSKAITSAGDVTDFADKTDVKLIRASGDRFVLNLNRILSGKDPDPPVYPGDQIVVERSIF